MAATGFETLWDAPDPPPRPWGLFLQVAKQTDPGPRGPLGVKFQADDYTQLTLNDSDCNPVDLGSPRTLTTVLTQPAFSVYDSVICSTLFKTWDELSEDIDERWNVLLSEAYARELLLATGSGGHSLTADAVDAGNTSTVEAAIAEMEGSLAIGLNGGQGMIHMDPTVLVYAVTNNTIRFNNGTYYSPGGHLIVADAGYMPATASASTATIYATGPVYWAATTREPIAPFNFENVDFTHNTQRAVEQARGLVLFDPATVWKTLATKA